MKLKYMIYFMVIWTVCNYRYFFNLILINNTRKFLRFQFPSFLGMHYISFNIRGWTDFTFLLDISNLMFFCIIFNYGPIIKLNVISFDVHFYICNVVDIDHLKYLAQYWRWYTHIQTHNLVKSRTDNLLNI